jgi:hypothetical protein
MSKENFSSLADWFLSVKANLGGNQHYVSVHVDQLEFFNLDSAKGEDLLQISCCLLDDIEILLSELNIGDNNVPLYPLLVLPLGYSKKIVFWKNQFVSNLGCFDEPPSLYLFRSEDIFNIDDEEYRCCIETAQKGIKALYRCHRSLQASRLDWEFSKDIYLFSKSMGSTGSS